MNDRSILNLILRYDMAQRFLNNHDQVKAILDQFESVKAMLERFESLEELEEILDLFEQQNYLQKDYFTVHEAAFYTGLTVSTLRHLSAERVLPIYKPKGKIMFKKKDLIEWIESARFMSNSEILEMAEHYTTKNYVKRKLPHPKPRRRKKS